MNIGRFSTAQLTEEILQEFYANDKIRNLHTNKKGYQRKPQKLSSLDNSSVGNSSELDEFFGETNIGKTEAIENIQASKVLSPLLEELVKVHESVSEIARAVAKSGNVTQSSDLSQYNDEYMNICKDMISELSKIQRNKLLVQRRSIDSYKCDLSSMNAAMQEMKIQYDSNLRQNVRYEQEIDGCRQQITSLEKTIESLQDQIHQMEISSSLDAKMIEDLRSNKKVMEHDMKETIKHIQNEQKMLMEQKIQHMKSMMMRDMSRSFDKSGSMMPSQPRKGKSTAQSASPSSSVNGSQSNPLKTANASENNDASSKSVHFSFPNISPSHTTATLTASSSSPAVSMVSLSPSNEMINSDGPVSLSDLVQASATSFKRPTVSSSCQTEVDEDGLWDKQDGWCLPVSGTILARVRWRKAMKYVLCPYCRGSPNYVNVLRRLYRATSVDTSNVSSGVEGKIIIGNSNSSSSSSNNNGNSNTREKLNLISNDPSMTYWSLPPDLTKFLVNLPRSILAAPLKSLNWCIGMIFSIFRWKTQADFIDEKLGYSHQEFPEFLVELALMNSNNRSQAEVLLYYILSSLKENYRNHGLLHTFCRFLSVIDQDPREFGKESSEKNNGKEKTLTAKKSVYLSSANTAPNASKRQGNSSNNGSSTTSSNDEFAIRITNSSLSLNMLNCYLFARECMLADYVGVYHREIAAIKRKSSKLKSLEKKLYCPELENRQQKSDGNHSSGNTNSNNLPGKNKASNSKAGKKGGGKTSSTSSANVSAQSSPLRDSVDENDTDHSTKIWDDMSFRSPYSNNSSSSNPINGPGFMFNLPNHVVVGDKYSLWIPLDRALRVMSVFLSFLDASMLTSCYRNLEYHALSLSPKGELTTFNGMYTVIRTLSKAFLMTPAPHGQDLSWERIDSYIEKKNSQMEQYPSPVAGHHSFQNSPVKGSEVGEILSRSHILCVDMDHCLSIILEALVIRSTFIETKLETIFSEGDLNGDGVLSFEEFTKIVKNVAPHFHSRQGLKMFREALMLGNDDDTIGPSAFVRVCKQFGLIHLIDIDRYRSHELKALCRPVYQKSPKRSTKKDRDGPETSPNRDPNLSPATPIAQMSPNMKNSKKPLLSNEDNEAERTPKLNPDKSDLDDMVDEIVEDTPDEDGALKSSETSEGSNRLRSRTISGTSSDIEDEYYDEEDFEENEDENEFEDDEDSDRSSGSHINNSLLPTFSGNRRDSFQLLQKAGKMLRRSKSLKKSLKKQIGLEYGSSHEKDSHDRAGTSTNSNGDDDGVAHDKKKSKGLERQRSFSGGEKELEKESDKRSNREREMDERDRNDHEKDSNAKARDRISFSRNPSFHARSHRIGSIREERTEELKDHDINESVDESIEKKLFVGPSNESQRKSILVYNGLKNEVKDENEVKNEGKDEDRYEKVPPSRKMTGKTVVNLDMKSSKESMSSKDGIPSNERRESLSYHERESKGNDETLAKEKNSENLKQYSTRSAGKPIKTPQISDSLNSTASESLIYSASASTSTSTSTLTSTNNPVPLSSNSLPSFQSSGKLSSSLSPSLNAVSKTTQPVTSQAALGGKNNPHSSHISAINEAKESDEIDPPFPSVSFAAKPRDQFTLSSYSDPHAIQEVKESFQPHEKKSMKVNKELSQELGRKIQDELRIRRLNR